MHMNGVNRKILYKIAGTKHQTYEDRLRFTQNCIYPGYEVMKILSSLSCRKMNTKYSSKWCIIADLDFRSRHLYLLAVTLWGWFGCSSN